MNLIYAAIAFLLALLLILVGVTRIGAWLIERRYPPSGEFVTVNGTRMHFVHVPAEKDADLPPLVFIVAVVTLVIFLTELTSNVATMTTLAPILGSLALAIGAAPESLLAPAAVAASCAFMLPVATAPNAIIYATGEVSVAQMMKRGLRVNLIGVVVISAIGYWLAPIFL